MTHTADTLITMQIDGRDVEVPQGAMIIEAAKLHDFTIPHFCYHEKLPIAANCRMCLVEVEKMPKVVPACATPVTAGMKVFTQSAKTKDAQRAVMEFLLINHPLDCPICDQGGECELQDNTIGYGNDTSPYDETKRVITDEDIGPLIQTNLTRCIQCTRCVRFGQEIAGLRELGMTSRGENSEIRTFVQHALASEVSGNIIDLCPVGALTSKPFLYKARAWELTQVKSIAPHDALGSNIYLHTKQDEIMRVVPQKNEAINEVWLSDRDRFSYTGIKHTDRLQSPMVKRNGHWHATDWETALDFALHGIQAAQTKHGAETLAAISAPNASLEEYYLLASLLKGIGASALSYHLRDTDISDHHMLPAPHFGLAIAEIETQDALLMIGSDLMRELPLLGLRFRKANLSGAVIDVINPADFTLNVTVNHKIIHAPQQLPELLAAIVKTLLTKTKNHPLQACAQAPIIAAATITPMHEAIAEQLTQNAKSFIYLGALAYHDPQAALIRQLTSIIAALTSSTWGMHTDGSNTAGLANIHQMLSLPHTSCAHLFKQQHKALLLHNLEPELDCANPYAFNKLLAEAEIVVALTPFKSAQLLASTDVLLPIATFGETSGSFLNIESTLQSFKGYVMPQGAARPAWRVLRVLGNLAKLNSFTYTSTEEILAEIQQDFTFNTGKDYTEEALIEALQGSKEKSSASCTDNECYRITQWPIYRIDNLVRRAEPLQASGTAIHPALYLNQTTLNHLGLIEGMQACVTQEGTIPITLEDARSNTDELSCMPSPRSAATAACPPLPHTRARGSCDRTLKCDEYIRLKVVRNDALPDHVALIPAGFYETSALGDSFGKISISKEPI